MVGKNGALKFDVPCIPFSHIAGFLKRGYLLYQDVSKFGHLSYTQSQNGEAGGENEARRLDGC